jgi:FAD/FMN-containing dehydrogenase
MQRRTLLRTAAALPFLTAGRAVSQAFPPRRVRPADSTWPDAALWNKLNDDVGGNLLVPRGLFDLCAADPNGVRCRTALEHVDNPYWIGDQAAGTEVSGWLDAWTPAPSAYAIRARNAADVARGVSFARDHNLRLVVKGGGHSYLGTSNAPDSLLIWTRAMRKVTLHDAFVAGGCEGRAAVPAVTAEAGAVWMDLYNSVTTEAGRYVQGGGCTTVGVAGLVQSGGFGSFSKGFGTAAAGLLEAEIVTADGRVRVVNECRDPDLFWALKGGGGGTFGVVTRVTLRTHDLPGFFGFAGGIITAASDAAFAELLARFVDFYRDSLLNQHWGEQIKLAPGNTLDISMVCQGLDDSRAKEVWQPFFDWVRTFDGLTVTAPLRSGAASARDWWKVGGNPAMIRDTRADVPANRGWWQGDQEQVGAFIHGFDSLWLPAALLERDRSNQLADALLAASRHQTVQLHFNKGLAGAPREALAATHQTATNPAALDAFALAIIADGESAAYPGLARPAVDLAAAHRDANDLAIAAAKLHEIVPNAGSYVSESNYFNRSWQSAYWGSNYSRLRAIKDRYDPDGLFVVHHGVGSEDWSADGFTRGE